MVVLHLLILIYLTVVKCFQTSPPSPQPKYLNYFGQCQTSHHRLALDYIPTSLLKSCADTFFTSSHTWQTYLSPRPLFHPSSNWHLSHPCWKNLVHQNRISQIPDQYPIWISSAKSSSILPLHIFFLTFRNLPVFLFYGLLIANFILLRLLCLNSQMISWKPLTPEKLQFSLLWILDMSAAFDTLDQRSARARFWRPGPLTSRPSPIRPAGPNWV